MKKITALLTVFSSVLVLAACAHPGTSADSYDENATSTPTSTKEGDVTSYESADNLEATNPLGCEPATTVENTRSAADIVAGAEACVAAEKFDEAAELVMVSSAFALFDTQRVADETAHGALQALYSQAFGGLPAEPASRLNTSINELSADNPRAQAVCSHLEASEPPNYFPGYMVSHGLGSFTGDGQDALVENFDADAAWAKALDFINCND